jgi:glycogen phosphorylase
LHRSDRLVAVRALKRLTVRQILPESLVALNDLALNLRWSWDAKTRDLFRSIDPELWAKSGDPLEVLGETSRQRFDELAADQFFVDRVSECLANLKSYLASNSWFQIQGDADVSAITGIAYFSPEFGVTGALPQYSGGLGILAGDHLKSASDLGIPIIGLGLFYKSGYFKQSLSWDAWQVEQYPVTNPDASPVSLLRDTAGDPVTIGVGMPDNQILHAQMWIAQVGRVPLILLDTDIEINDSRMREVTDRLYGGGSETRLQQEMLLGIGGIRALRAYCKATDLIEPNVFHTNEGHAGFLGLERIRELVQGVESLSFDQALEATRANTVFTTHTPVPAGIDRFPVDLITRYFGGDNAEQGLPVERIIELGVESSDDYFNMAMMGFRLAGRANGVSQLHGEVSREMFAHLWPNFDAVDIPITSITNGVHAPTWVAPELFQIAREEFGGGELDVHDPDAILGRLGEISVHRLWEIKRSLRQSLVEMSRKRLFESWIERGASPIELAWTKNILDPDILTIGFARRVPSYKRLTLMLRDEDRLRSLLTHPDWPVQIVVAGKAHPADDGGKSLIQKLVKFSDHADLRDRIVFLPNYDIEMATTLYPGCDVWLNNPIRPLEASGTSGMKAALNGALNLSIMDGWWDEWFDGHNGWAIPSADSLGDSELRDNHEARALYDLIESEVVPTFYRRGEDGIPHDWMNMVSHTLRTLGPKVLATRMVKEYVHRLYAPAALNGSALSIDDYRGASELSEWKHRVRSEWQYVTVDHVEADIQEDTLVLGSAIHLRAYINIGNLLIDDVSVQAVFGHVDSVDEIIEPNHVELNPEINIGQGRWIYTGKISLDVSGAFGYSIRITPSHSSLVTTADLGLQAVPRPHSGTTEILMR